MKKHTNIDNEITGAYYEEEHNFWKSTTFWTILIITLLFIAADYIFGAETVTNVLADLITY
jgi:hypothetical protein